jgi:hypothetical protein
MAAVRRKRQRRSAQSREAEPYDMTDCLPSCLSRCEGLEAGRMIRMRSQKWIASSTSDRSAQMTDVLFHIREEESRKVGHQAATLCERLL